MRLIPRRQRRIPGDDSLPLAPLRKPITECRLALVVSSVCLATSAQAADPQVTIGEPLLREISGGVDTSELRRPHSRRDVETGQVAIDVGAGNLDRNLALGIDCLRRAVAGRRLGGLDHRHFAVCGPMTATRSALEATASQAAEAIAGDAVDAALLVPT